MKLLLPSMRKDHWSIVALFIGLLCCLGILARQMNSHSGTPTSAASATKLPGVVLWAWERPEKLDFIEPEKVAVAFLAKTISLRADHLLVRPRLQPLQVPIGTRMIAVVRVESARTPPPSLSAGQLEAMVTEISKLAEQPNVAVVQIDFDATRSERDFYRKAILQIRERLPAETALSITALASWCIGDDWLSNLPIDEAIPMLFRMGIDRPQILSQLQTGSAFTSKPCQASAGVSTDEPVALNSQPLRLYIFNPKSWSAESFKTAMEIYHR